MFVNVLSMVDASVVLSKHIWLNADAESKDEYVGSMKSYVTHAVKVEVDSVTVVRHVDQLARHYGREHLATSHAFKAVTVMPVLSGTETDAFCQGIAPGSRRYQKLDST